MEEKFVLQAADGFKIYGLVNSPDKKKNTKAILHIHGLTGSQYDYCAVQLAQNLPKHGYDVIRLNLYHWEDGARSLIDCTLQHHASDINTAIGHFKKKYKKLFATGHSYGGPSLMMAKINEFTAVSLWDPSFIPQKSIGRKDYIKSGCYYISTAGTPYVVGKDFIDEAVSFDRNHALKLAKKCKAPLQTIYGDKESIWIHYGESFHTHAKGPTDERVIKKSQHCFFEEGAIAPLLRYTRQWFDRF